MTSRSIGARRAAFAAAAALLLSFPATSLARPGDLVPGFGSGGKVFTNFTSRDSQAFATTISGGKVLVAGMAHNGTNYDMAVVRLNADGTVDTSFGILGRAIVDFGGSDAAYAIAVQADGKILLGGGAYSGASSFLLTRLNANGTLDDTFGEFGVVVTQFTLSDYIRGLAVQGDGKIVAVGETQGSGSSDYAVARYNADGSLDLDFGCAIPGSCTGKVVTNLGASSYESANAVVVQGDGKIVAAGSSGTGTSGDFGLVRYNANGTLDTNFGCSTPPCSGIVRTSISANEDAAYALVLQPDGKLVAGGSTYVDSTNLADFALVRYMPNGTLDTAFGLSGRVTTDFIGRADVIHALALQGDGKIVAAGVASSALTNDFGLARYESNGFLDANFGCPTPGSCSGKVTTAATNAQDYANGVALQADGKIVAAGVRELQYPLWDVAVMRYGTNGVLDTSFGTAGKVFVAFSGSDDFANAIALSGSSLFVAGSAGEYGLSPTVDDFAVAKYLSTGALDTSFGTGGKVRIDFTGGSDVANAVLVQGDGKVVLVGTGTNGATTDFALARLNTNGSLDSGFGIGGKVFAAIGAEGDEALAAVLQGDGKIVAGGLAYSGTDSTFALARFNTNGSPDGTFGSGGKLTTAFAAGASMIQGLALQPDGKIVAAGSAGPDSNLQMAIARYTSTGALDTSFGCASPGTCAGKVSLNFGSTYAAFRAVKLRGDGKIIAAGYIQVGSVIKMAVVRFNGDGTVDTTFGSSGLATISFGSEGDSANAVALDASGRIIVGGNSSSGGSSFASVARLNPNGGLDSSFGTGGKVMLGTPGGVFASTSAIVFAPASSTIYLANWMDNPEYSGSLDFMVAALDGSGAVITTARRNDLNGDGTSDILIRDNSNGLVYGWLMNGLVISSGGYLLDAGSGWTPVRIADLNGDGKADILIQHTDGSLYAWIMDGLTVTTGGYLLGAGSGWSVSHIGDFNGDGKEDILLKHTDGSIYIWLMDGYTVSSGTYLQGAGTGWSATHVADFNGDGKSDVLLKHTDGSIYIWQMNGIVIEAGTFLKGAGIDWSPTETGDFNGDGKADILITHTNGGVYLWQMDGITIATGTYLLSPGSGWVIGKVGDLSGDGKSDIIIVHTDGSHYAWIMDGLTVSTGGYLLGASTGWSVSHLQDLNADGRNDILLKHTDGSIYGWLMNGATVTDGTYLMGAGPWRVTP